jgi:hypothetical protein
VADDGYRGGCAKRRTLEPGDDLGRGLLGRLARGFDAHLGVQRRLVGIGDAREFGDLARPGLGVQALHVPRLAVLERGSDVDLDEVVHVAAHFVAHGSVRRDRRGHGHHVVAREQTRDEADAPDVDVAVGFREREPLRDVLAHLVAGEELDPVAPRLQLGDHDVRDRALARTRKAGEPEAEAGGRARGAHALQVTGGPSRG